MNRVTTIIFVILLLAVSALATDPPEPAAEGKDQVETERKPEPESETQPVRALSPQNGSVRGLHAGVSKAGSLKVDLDGRFRHALVLKVSPEGARTIECVDNADRLVELLETDRSESAESPEGSKED